MAGTEERSGSIHGEDGYTIDQNTLESELKQKGYCVVPGVLTEEQCDEYVDEYKAWLARFGEAWPQNIRTIIQGYGIGHLNATWQVRLALKPLFSRLWGTEKLLASFDGVAISDPPGDKEWRYISEGETSLHLDQCPSRLGLHSYQGAVYLEETGIKDYCLRVSEGSHNYFEEFFSVKKAAQKHSSRNQFLKFDQGERDWLKSKGCRLTRIPVPKGGVVLWDSRLAHEGAPPEPDTPHKDRWRFVVFVSMAPACWAGEDDLQAKKMAYSELKMTTHWPSEKVAVLPRSGAVDDFGLKTLPDIACTPEAQLLAGVKGYDYDDGKSNGPDWKPIWG